MKMQLYKLSENFNNAMNAMQEMYESGEIDAETLSDTLEGLDGELQEKMLNTAMQIKNLNAQEAALQDEIKNLSVRAKRAADQSAWLTQYLETHMMKTGTDKLETPSAVVKFKKLPDVVSVTGDVPHDLCRHKPESWEPDKRAIGEKLKAGESLEYAELITDRRKLDVK